MYPVPKGMQKLLEQEETYNLKINAGQRRIISIQITYGIAHVTVISDS